MFLLVKCLLRKGKMDVVGKVLEVSDFQKKSKRIHNMFCTPNAQKCTYLDYITSKNV